jgi:hypothetical protein
VQVGESGAADVSRDLDTVAAQLEQALGPAPQPE